jgi:ribonuclease HI
LEKYNDEGTTKVVVDTHSDSITNQQGRWGEMKSKINVDPSLDPVKVDQLWQLLEQFSNVFIWHKNKLGLLQD